MKINRTQLTPLIIVGASGHARVVADIALQANFDVMGFIDDFVSGEEAQFLGRPILGDRKRLENLRDLGVEHAFIAIGDSRVRGEFLAELERARLVSPCLVHPSSVISRDVELGEGTLVAASAVLNANVEVGRQCIVNTGTIVEHDCRVEDLAHLCPGVTLAGGVHIGRAAWVGIGATVIENVKIGENALVGAGSVVIDDVAPGSRVVGVPARPISG